MFVSTRSRCQRCLQVGNIRRAAFFAEVFRTVLIGPVTVDVRLEIVRVFSEAAVSVVLEAGRLSTAPGRPGATPAMAADVVAMFFRRRARSRLVVGRRQIHVAAVDRRKLVRRLTSRAAVDAVFCVEIYELAVVRRYRPEVETVGSCR